LLPSDVACFVGLSDGLIKLDLFNFGDSFEVESSELCMVDSLGLDD